MRLGDKTSCDLRGMLRQPRITHVSCSLLHSGIFIAAAVICLPPRITRKSSTTMPDVFKESAYSLQLAGFSLAVLGHCSSFFCRYAGAHGVSSARPWRPFTSPMLAQPRWCTGWYFAQLDSQFNLTLLACYSSTVLLFCWLAHVSAAGLIVLLVLFGVPSCIKIALVIIPCLFFVSLPLTRYTTARCLCWPVNLRCGFLRSCRHSFHWLLINGHNSYTSGIASSAAVMMAEAVVLPFWIRKPPVEPPVDRVVHVKRPKL